jgi:hypothetical protein
MRKMQATSVGDLIRAWEALPEGLREMGETPNIAARKEGTAASNTVVISHATLSPPIGKVK